MNVRDAATSVFVFILLGMASGLISANVRKLADKHGWDNFLVHGIEKFCWERLRGLWWLWSIFGLSGGIALALWLAPLLIGPPTTTVTSTTDAGARKIDLLQSQLATLDQKLSAITQERDDL